MPMTETSSEPAFSEATLAHFAAQEAFAAAEIAWLRAVATEREASGRDETDADLVGLELAARAGYDPRASVSLWRKMATASKNQGGIGFLSTHPSGSDRIRILEANVPKVDGLYRAAAGPR